MIDPVTDVSPDEVAWLLLALAGIALHVANLLRYRRQRPRGADEARVRRMGLVSSVIHVGIKIGFLLGVMLAMTQPWPSLAGTELALFYAWRAAILGIIVALDAEAVYLRVNREALARSRRPGAEQAQRDRMEATGEDTNRIVREDRAADEEIAERLRRGHIGDREAP